MSFANRDFGERILKRERSSYEENFFESSPEISVEDGVDDGVQGRVAVAEPEGRGEARGCDVALGAQGFQDVEHEEGQPGQDKGGHDQPQDEGGPALPCLRQPALLALGVRGQSAGRQVAVGPRFFLPSSSKPGALRTCCWKHRGAVDSASTTATMGSWLGATTPWAGGGARSSASRAPPRTRRPPRPRPPGPRRAPPRRRRGRRLGHLLRRFDDDVGHGGELPLAAVHLGEPANRQLFLVFTHLDSNKLVEK
ncbi:hypothetical protein CEXT_390161 [Caerostris extrusa]|uniref:Uncharacterized protein n=1 Tax=Caerostris extrusa TaxID=172846 RepID=A0AAV4SR94_CAEEX|nr:hypothetical protein CEXT_390161 [Caerostris extrusa]